MDELTTSERIYKVLTHKQFRSGPLPTEDVRRLILEKIEQKVSEHNPIRIFQFWGGCKNPNLPVDYAEQCEEATLANLKRMGDAVTAVYAPGLRFIISPGDGRVQNVNRVPKEKTQKYVNTLTSLAGKYSDFFTVIPVSTFYAHYQDEFQKKLEEVTDRISADLATQDLEKLTQNAGKNFFEKDSAEESGRKAATDYVLYRVAEEEAGIFREFDDCIRSFFIKYIPFYRHYIVDIQKTRPRLDCSLIFYTGGKGNITQPWQAVGESDAGKVSFMSQGRLKRREPYLQETNI